MTEVKEIVFEITYSGCYQGSTFLKEAKMRCIPIIFKATMLLFLILMLPRLVLAAKRQDLGQAGEMIVSDRTLSDMKETETAMLAQWKKESAGQSRRFIGGGKYIDPNGEEWKYSVVLPSKMEPGKKYPVFLGMTTYALSMSESQEQYPCYTMACFSPASVISLKKDGKGYDTIKDYKSVLAAGYKAVIDKALAANPGMDASRIYVEGASKFGATAWLAAYNYPDTFAAVVCNVGGTELNKALQVAARNIGVCLYYGVLDGGEPDFQKHLYSHTAPYLYKALTEAGYTPFYTKFLYGDHRSYGFSDSPKNPAWNDFTRLRKWLFEQKKPAADWPIINSPSAAAATVGKPFTYTITADSKPTSFKAVLTSEHIEDNNGKLLPVTVELPRGLSLDSKTGILSGTPSEAGNFFIRLNAINDKGTGITTLLLTVK